VEKHALTLSDRGKQLDRDKAELDKQRKQVAAERKKDEEVKAKLKAVRDKLDEQNRQLDQRGKQLDQQARQADADRSELEKDKARLTSDREDLELVKQVLSQQEQEMLDQLTGQRPLGRVLMLGLGLLCMVAITYGMGGRLADSGIEVLGLPLNAVIFYATAGLTVVFLAWAGLATVRARRRALGRIDPDKLSHGQRLRQFAHTLDDPITGGDDDQL
jgi:small-conductance mechanosensitive channel